MSPSEIVVIFIAPIAALIVALVALSKALAAQSSAKRAHERIDEDRESTYAVVKQAIENNVQYEREDRVSSMKAFAAAVGYEWRHTPASGGWHRIKRGGKT